MARTCAGYDVICGLRLSISLRDDVLDHSLIRQEWSGAEWIRTYRLTDKGIYARLGLFCTRSVQLHMNTCSV